ncbi:MAG: nucleotidyltransferase domain-containing protein, partial [Armatimonadetes bacterium]|nr:nucleotidyltransferase domain-containing protein [Armatimonadota bacterium]
MAELLAPRHQATVLLGGSAARGLADDHSDLDLFVITPGVIPSAERHAWLRRVAEPGSLFLDQPVRTGGLADTARAKGRDLTLCYRRAAAVVSLIVALALLAGCQSDATGGFGDEVFPGETGNRSVNQFAAAQAASGARQDATL